MERRIEKAHKNVAISPKSYPVEQIISILSPILRSGFYRAIAALRHLLQAYVVQIQGFRLT